MHRRVVVRSPINIALVKYWGKEDEESIIPCNSSISMTLDLQSLFTQTAVTFSNLPGEDSFELNGKAAGISVRMRRSIQMMRSLLDSSAPEASMPIAIRSENNFPTAAGMASSASGISALVYALRTLFGLESKVSTEQLTEIARIGSGSACRSIPSGFVVWHCGLPQHASRSYAESLAPPAPQMNIFIYIFSTQPKETSSSDGMLLTKQTSSLFQHRIREVAPARISQMTAAIHARNWPLIFELTIRDSNSFHACCLDTFPPIHYLNDQSFHLIDAVCAFNRLKGECRVGYSFDAGSNGFAFLVDEDVDEWLQYSHSKLPVPIKCKMGNGTEIVQVE